MYLSQKEFLDHFAFYFEYGRVSSTLKLICTKPFQQMWSTFNGPFSQLNLDVKYLTNNLSPFAWFIPVLEPEPNVIHVYNFGDKMSKHLRVISSTLINYP